MVIELSFLNPTRDTGLAGSFDGDAGFRLTVGPDSGGQVQAGSLGPLALASGPAQDGVSALRAFGTELLLPGNIPIAKKTMAMPAVTAGDSTIPAGDFQSQFQEISRLIDAAAQGLPGAGRLTDAERQTIGAIAGQLAEAFKGDPTPGQIAPKLEALYEIALAAKARGSSGETGGAASGTSPGSTGTPSAGSSGSSGTGGSSILDELLGPQTDPQPSPAQEAQAGNRQGLDIFENMFLGRGAEHRIGDANVGPMRGRIADIQNALRTTAFSEEQNAAIEKALVDLFAAFGKNVNDPNARTDFDKPVDMQQVDAILDRIESITTGAAR